MGLSEEGVIARTILYRNELKRLVGKYPNAVCINLGCGFDDKFSQVDNGTITWFDVDLPDQIEVRRKVYEDRERCKMIEGNALDGYWTSNIPKSDMYIICMEGVLEYFSKEQVRIYAYGSIPGLKFTRTKTIGAGDELCDFNMELVKKS